MAGSTSLGADRVVKEDGLYTQLTDEVLINYIDQNYYYEGFATFNMENL